MELKNQKNNHNWKDFYNIYGNNKSLGQNFLVNSKIIEDILNKITLGEHILEIGGGLGILSYHILQKLNHTGFLWIVEIDKKLCKHLINLLQNSPYNNFQVLQEDALNVDFSPYDHIIGNLPFNISTPILMKCALSSVKQISCMVQLEMYNNLLQQKTYMGKIMTHTFNLKRIMILSPQCFYPKPKIYSIFFHGIRQHNIYKEDIIKLQYLFKFPRKKIRNNPYLISSEVYSNLRPENITIPSLKNFKIIN